MKLVIGGYAQGKLNYVLNKYDPKTIEVINAKIPENIENLKGTVIIHQFHNWVRRKLTYEEQPEKEIFDFIKRYPDCVIISDEIGNGIVPIEAFEREYRERTGRILVEMAKKADEVERVICGIGQKIK